MRKPWIVAAILAVLLVAGVMILRYAGKLGSQPGERLTDGQVGMPGAVVFDLRYRGLTSLTDEFSYHRAWGFQRSLETDPPFVQAVKHHVREFDLVCNPALRGAEWSVVELKDKKAVALYFDLDANGSLSDNERILPRPLSTQYQDVEVQFVTPDFMMRQKDGREIPFRVMLVRCSPEYGGEYMWSPACVLEGQAAFSGQPMRLFLYGDQFSGSFTTFGQCSFALLPVGRKPEGDLPRTTLSSLICHQRTFYRLKFDGAHEKDKTLRLILVKDTSPVGRVAVNLTGKDLPKIRLDNATITGANDSSIQVKPESILSLLPVGKYRLSSGRVLYGAESDDQWRVDFSEGPDFAVARNETTDVKIGGLALAVKAVEEQRGDGGDVKKKTVYSRDASIYLSPQIKGAGSEVYTRFSRKDAGSGNMTNIEPHITIVDRDGKQVASADLEYG